jgi:predicted nucleic acid-binding protein
MKGDFFIDTNIIAYGFGDESNKRTLSRNIMAYALRTGKASISIQVIQEFCNLALRKFQNAFKPSELAEYARTSLHPICKVYPSFELLERALKIHENHRLSYFDSLIVSAAIEGRCKYLLTEDMNDGQSIEGVAILNPFGDEKRLLAALPELKLP